MERMQLTWNVSRDMWQAWHHGRPRDSTITVGRLGDGRWYADRSGAEADERDEVEGACLFGADEDGKQAAIATAERWMRDDPEGWEST